MASLLEKLANLVKSVIQDEDIETLDDLDHHYPLPPGYKFAEDVSGSPMVIRESDQSSRNFLVEDGLLVFHEPHTGEGEDPDRVIEVPKKGTPPL